MAKPRCSKRSRIPRRPYDKDRLIDEMKLLGEYGLKNKTELWTIEKICNDIKKRARNLLINPHENEVIVNGRSLLDNLVGIGIFKDVDFKDINDIKKNLEKVLDLTSHNFLERRLQYRVFEAGLARSVHHARNLIGHKHISIKGQIVNKPGYMVSAENEGHIEISSLSSLCGAKLGRNKKRKLKVQAE